MYFYRGGAANVTLIDVPALVEDVISSFTDYAARLGADITRDIRLTRQVSADGIQLQMVLHNLLANALDALADVAAGHRRVHIAVVTEGARLKVMVEDSGCGVSAEIRDQLFEPFVTHKRDGMGLGLAISRSLLRSQGGELRLDATGTSGARFLIELPLRSPEPAI